MKLKSLPGAALAWLRETRCKWLLFMVLLGLSLRENYPFSHYPMYSSFSRRTYYIYLADANGRALRTRDFGLSSSTLKKIFDRFRQKELKHSSKSAPDRVEKAESAAGQALLQYLEGLHQSRRSVKKLPAGAGVQHVTVRQSGDSLVLETRTVARNQ